MRAAHKRISFVFQYVKQMSTDQVSKIVLLCVPVHAHKPFMSKIADTYVGPLHSLSKASRDMTWPHTNFIGGLSSELCWRKIGHANIE